MNLVSPPTGEPLAPDTPHSLTDGKGGRWPVVEGIPYLRVGREVLVAEVLALLDAGEEARALIELLRDADDWWDEAPPARADVADLLRNRDRATLRQAMAALGYGRVGDYFAHRWTDPTFVAGLGLIETRWNRPGTAFELACGIGHYMRALEIQGVEVTGGDVVFSKLWVARQFVVGPKAKLVCFDAAAPWPLRGTRFDLVLCQDAFYFLQPKPDILARLRESLARDGALLVGHVHNGEAPSYSAGAAVAADELSTLFPTATAYDDAELTQAAAEGREPVPQPLDGLRRVEAFALAEGPGVPAPGLLMPSPHSPRLRRNPLYEHDAQGWTVAWPSERYRAEYAPLATYPARDASPGPSTETVRRRIFVDLPERW